MLVVIAGVPGAGKTTLADRLESSGVPVLDSDRVRRRWEARMRWLPYGAWRPFVHLAHWLAILAVLRRGEPAIVVRPFTSGRLRRLVLRRARIPVHLIALTASPAEARDGQRRRGRKVSERAMTRHERAWSRALPRLEDEGWASIRRLSRAEAAGWAPGRSPVRVPASRGHRMGQPGRGHGARGVRDRHALGAPLAPGVAAGDPVRAVVQLWRDRPAVDGWARDRASGHARPWARFAREVGGTAAWGIWHRVRDI